MAEPLLVDVETSTLDDRTEHVVVMQIETPPRAKAGNWGLPPKPWHG